MSGTRPFALVQADDQWLRSAHQNTALERDIVLLATQKERPIEGSSDPAPPIPAGLAFDPWGRLYHSRPEAGQVDRLAWTAGGSDSSVAPVPLFSEAGSGQRGDFALGDGPPPVLQQPGPLAVDCRGRLFVAENGLSRILVFDLNEQRLVRIVEFEGHPHVLDLEASGHVVFVLLDREPFLMLISSSRGPRDLSSELKSRGIQLSHNQLPARLACAPDESTADERHDDLTALMNRLTLLVSAGTKEARIIPPGHSGRTEQVPYATDLEFLDNARTSTNNVPELVVSRNPGTPFLRFALKPKRFDRLSSLRARNYDGRGITRAPNGLVGFWSRAGFRHAAVSAAKYKSSGQVTTFRLDSGQFQMQWGRVFLDACIPADTSVRIQCITSDETPRDSLLPHSLPANINEAEIVRADLSPLPPASWIPDESAADWQPLHRRETGRELPWARSSNSFETYEAPVLAPPGRYLWVTLLLQGNTRRTPRLRSLRVEYPSHDLMVRLPRLYSRHPAATDFLRRYLAMFDGMLGTLDARAWNRHVLIDPAATPREALPWLSSLVGMTLDQRWSEAARRTVLAEAVELFRFRGTIRGLLRLLRIYLGFDVGIVEAYRFRALGGGRLGQHDDPRAAAVVGSFRVSGATDFSAMTSPVSYEAKAVSNGTTDGSDEACQKGPAPDVDPHAHRFSVVIPSRLSREQSDVVRHILDVHRPAHTLYEICTVDSGLRIGSGAHLELTTVIGPSGEFGSLLTGRSLVGHSDVAGHPAPGGPVSVTWAMTQSWPRQIISLRIEGSNGVVRDTRNSTNAPTGN